jgi:hypothetical protein
MLELSQNIVPSLDQPLEDISHLSRDQKEQYLKLLKEKTIRIKQNRIIQYYPET